MNIDKHISFSVDVIKGRDKATKEPKEYYAICVNVLGIKKVIAWLTETQFKDLKTKLS